MGKGVRKRKKIKPNKERQTSKSTDPDGSFSWRWSYLKIVISYGQIVGVLQELSNVCHDRLLIRVTDINV